VNHAPYRIVTSRVVIRCWDPRDAPPLKEAIDSSLDHLRPWMTWTEDEPQSLDEKVALLRTFRGNFDLGKSFGYGIFGPDETEVLGGIGLHTGVGDEAFEIGYWIRASRASEGLGTHATAAVTRVGFEVCEVDRIEIHCDPKNERSRSIPRKLGYVEEATLRRRLRYPEPRDVIVYSLFRDTFPHSPAASTPLEAYDVRGERVL
jgi:RimJ/RimL family protein N-acetyltransferase